MITNKEMQERKKTIGASEVHKLYNFDTITCQKLWEEKIGLVEREELTGDSIDAGNILEEQCLDFYEKKIGEKIFRNERIEHKNIKNFIVSLDGRTDIPIENKCINQFVFDEWISKKKFNAIDENGNKYNIPTNYYLQLQAQMEVLESDKGILLANALTYEEVINPLEVEINELHQTPLIVERNTTVCEEIKKRVIYMLDCLKYKKRPSELEYLDKNLY